MFLSSYPMPDTVLNTLYVLNHIIPTIYLHTYLCYYPHFTDVETRFRIAMLLVQSHYMGKQPRKIFYVSRNGLMVESWAV